MLIGLHGKKGHGKDAALERLHTLLPGVFSHFSFAAKMKASAAALLGIDLDTMERLKRDEEYNFLSIWDPEVSEETGSPVSEQTMRTFLQRYGTESHRDVFGQNFWVEQAMEPLTSKHGAPLDYDRWPLRFNSFEKAIPVFTDCRFPNEAEAVLNHPLGGVVFHIIGPEDGEEDTHASEVVLPPHLITATIDNTIRGDNFESLDRQLLIAVAKHDVLERT